MRRVGPWGRSVMVAVALVAGLAGSAAGVRLSGYDGPPDTAAGVSAATTAIGSAPAGPVSGETVICGVWCPDQAGPGVVAFDADTDRTDTVSVLYDLPGSALTEAEARRRLVAAGWRDSGDWLAKDGLRVTLQLQDTTSGVRAYVLTAKDTSAAAVVLAMAGLALGAVAGWLLAALAIRRRQQHGPLVRGVTGTVAAVFVACTALFAVHVVMLLVGLARAGWQPHVVQTAEFTLTVLPGEAAALAAVAAFMFVVLTLPVRPHRIAVAAPQL